MSMGVVRTMVVCPFDDQLGWKKLNVRLLYGKYESGQTLSNLSFRAGALRTLPRRAGSGCFPRSRAVHLVPSPSL